VVQKTCNISKTVQDRTMQAYYDGLKGSRIRGFDSHRSIATYVHDHGTWTSQTDGRTDRRTDDILWHNRAMRSIAR